MRDNLPETKDGTYLVNLDEYESVENCWITLYVNCNNVTSFNSFGVVHILKEIKKFIDNKNINIYRIEVDNSIMCGYFCLGFIDLFKT